MISTFIFSPKLKAKLFFIIFFSAFQVYLNAQVAGGTATANPATICSGQNTIIKLTGQSGTHIRWQIESSGTFVFMVPDRTSDTLLTPALTSPTRFRAVVSVLNLLLYDTSSIANVAIAPFSVGGTFTVSDADICSGEAITVKLNGDQTGNLIQWQLDTTNTFVDIPGAVTSPYSTPPLNKTTNFRAKITSSPCPSDFSNSGHVKVTPASVGGETDKDSTICSGYSVKISLKGNKGSIQWQIDTTGTFVNISGATSKPYDTPLLTKTSKFRAAVTNGNCATVFSTVTTITVNPGVTAGILTADHPVLCSGSGAILTLTGTTAGANIKWQSKTTGAFADIPGETNATLHTGNLSTTTTYRAIVSLNTCSTTSAPVTITVNPIPSPGTAAAVASTICSGNNTNINLTGTTAGATIQWQSNASGSFSDIAGANTTVLNTGTLTAATSYKAVVKLNGCTATSNVVTVTVNPDVTSGTAAAVTSTLCSNNNTDINLTGATAGATIQWQSNASGSFVDIPGANSATLNTGNLTSTTGYQAVVKLNGCSATSNIVTITVNPGVAPGTAAAVTSTLCNNNNNGTVINLTGTTAGATIQWQSNASGSFVDISGAINATLNTGNLSATTGYQAVVKLNGCNATSNIVTITVKPTPIPGTASAVTSTLCSGNSTTINLAGTSAGVTIQWQSNASGSFADIPNANGASLSTGNLSTTTIYQAVVVLNGCIATSNTATVTVNPTPYPGNASVTNNVLCSGDGTMVNLVGTSGGVTIQWQSKTTGVFTDISGANGSSYAATNLTTTTSYQAVVKLNGCVANSNTVTVTVNPVPASGTASSAISTVCSGSGTDLSLTGATAGAIIVWQSSTNGTFTDIPNSNTTILATGALNTTTSYQASVTLNNCSATSNPVTITVHPGSSPGTVTAGTTLLCEGDSTVLKLTGSTGSIQWQKKTTGTYSDIPNATTDTYNTHGLTTVTTFRAVVGNNGCSSTSNPVTITVNPKPVGGNITPANTIICTGKQVTLTLKNYFGQIQWQTDASGSFVDINQETDPTYKTPILYTTTRYQAVLKNTGCPTITSPIVTVTIAPLSKGGDAFASPSTICSNQTSTIKLTNFIGTSIQWQKKVLGGNYSDMPLGLNDSSFNTPPLTNTTFYRAIVKNSNCAEAISEETQVNISPSSVGGTAVADSSFICSGTKTAIRLKDYTGTSIQWQSDASGTFSDITTNGNSDVYQVINLTKTTSYKAIVKSNNCPSSESTVSKITIAPASVGGSISASSTSICSGATTKLTLSGHTGTNIKWQKNEAGTFVTIPGAVGIEYNTPTLYEDTEYRALVANGYCTATASGKITISIIPALDGGIAKADQTSVCSGTSTIIRLSGQTGSYQWQANDGSGTFIDIPGAKDADYTTPNLTSTISYRALVSGGTCSSVTSTVTKVTVNPASKGGIATAVKTIVCSGTGTVITLNDYDGTIDWQVDDSGTGNGAFTDIGEHSTSYTVHSITKKTRYRARVTRAGCSSVFSVPVTIDVVPPSIAGTISSTAISVCPGGIVTLTLNGSSGDIQWQSDTLGFYSNIPSATGTSYTTFPIRKETNFHAVVTNGNCPSVITDNLTIKIAPALSGGKAIAIPSTVCKGSGTSIHLREYTGNIQWQSNASGVYTDIPNQTDTVLSIQSLIIGTSYRAVVSSGSCPTATSAEALVSVIPASEGGTAIPTSPTICSGTSTTITLTGNVGSIQWQQSDASGTFTDINGATGSTCNTGTLTKNTSFRAVVTSNGCAPINSSVAFVSVTPASSPGVATAVQSSICSGGSATINLTGYVGTQIQWQSDASGAYVDIIGANGSMYTTTLTALTSFRARVKNGSCNTATSNAVTISITPVLKGGIAKATPSSVCSGTTTTIKLSGHTGPLIQWQTNASGSYVDIPNATDSTFVTPPLSVATNYRAHVNGSGCPQATSTVANVSIIPLSAGGTVNATPSSICSGEKSVLSLSGYVGSIQWQSDESGTYKNIPNETNPTYTTPALNSSVSYRAIVTSGSCSPEKSTNTLVAVVPSSLSGIAKATPSTVCNGGTSKITLTGAVGDKFQWQSDASGVFADIPNATSQDFTTPALSVTTSYRVVVTNGNCHPSVSNPVTITITPVLNGGTATAVQSTICKGTFATIKLAGQSGSIIWQTNASGTYKDIPGATSNTLNTPILTVPTSFKAILSSGGCAPVQSNVVDIAIIPSSVGGVASAKYPTVCSGERDTILLTGNIGAIQWQIDTSGVFIDIPGATGSFYATPPLTVSAHYQAVVTSGGCAPTTSSEAFVSVAPASKGGTATASATKICSGATTQLSLNGYIGAIHWQSDTSGVFTDIPGATGITFTTGPLKTATSFRALVRNGNCPAVASNVLTVTITPALSGGTTSADPNTVCKGTSSTIRLKDHSGAVRWQTNASGSWIDIDTLIATDIFYVTPPLLIPTSYRAVVSSSGCASVTSTPITVAVSPASTAGSAIAAPSSICSGETTTINLTGYTGTIKWQTNASGVFADIPLVTGSSYKTPALLKATGYRAIVTNGSCLPDTSTIALVSIIPAAVGGIPVATASTVCTGGTTTIKITKYTGTNIQWQRDVSGVFTDITGAVGIFYSTPPLAVPTTYRARVNTGNCSFSVSAPITISVTDELEGGVATVVPSTVCDSTPTTINLINYKGSIQWQIDTLGKFVNIPGATSTPYTTPPLKANTRFLAMISSGNCPTVYSNIVTAYVTPQLSAGVITATPSTICNGETTKLKINGHTGNVQWQQKDSLGKFVNIPGQTADTCRIPLLVQSSWFRAKISSGSCTPVITDSVMINVNVVATPTGDAVQQFCSIIKPTVANLKVNITPDTVKWYAAAFGGTALTASTPLVDGAFYYAAHSAYGCESYKRFKVKAVVFKSATVALQPKNITTCPGLNAFFHAKGDGTTLSYRWMVDENGTGNYKYITDNLTTYKGSLTDTLKVLNVTNSMNGFSFKCVIKGNCSQIDSAKSEGAALIISPNTTVNQQPISIGMCYGDAAMFTVTATGSALNYQWQVDSTSAFINLNNDLTYSNTNTSSLKIKAFTPFMAEYKYRCVITSGVCGTTVNTQDVSLTFDEECNVYPVNIPTGFSPNDDGVNDKLVIEGLENYPGSIVRIFNVWGDLVYEKTDYQNDWDAKANVKNVVGEGKLPGGTYYIYVDLKKGKRGKATFLIIKY